MKNPINGVWEGYRELVVPKQASAAQVVETQRAFFAGALALYEYIMRHGLDAGDEITDGDLERMADVDRELRAFGKALDTEVFHQRGNA